MTEQNKPLIEIKTYFDDLKEIKELLPQIATLQERYDVDLELHVVNGVKTIIQHFS